MFKLLTPSSKKRPRVANSNIYDLILVLCAFEGLKIEIDKNMNLAIFKFKTIFVGTTLILNSIGLARANNQKLEDVIQKSLNFVQESQKKQNEGLYFKGEWPVEMRSYLIPALLGVGKLFAQPVEEPTSFATASISNLLAGIYFENSKYQQIKPMITEGLSSIELNYKSGDIYSYYTEMDYKGAKVRGPRAGNEYVPKYIQGLTNIPPDADTTSVTYTAHYYDQLMNEMQIQTVPRTALDTFSTFRDLNRSSHYYNKLDGISNSGAFMTWFIDEKSSSVPRGVFDKPDKGARIPFNFNDVDCVVNGNVLRMLTLTKNQNQAGYKESCDVLNYSVEKNLQSQCGIYYPNSYAVFFTLSNAYVAGASCLEESRKKSITTILEGQNYSEGSWSNDPGIGRTDKVQSTALALIALMNYTEKENIRYDYSVKLGVQFLLSQAEKKSDLQLYWPGEFFFSAVAQARNTVLWRSDTYTTALVTLALVKSQNYLKGL